MSKGIEDKYNHKVDRKTIWTPDKVRERIRVGNLIQAIEQHALGRRQMSATAIRAAEVVLRKALPDLSAVEHSGFVETPPTREEIVARFTALHAAAVSRIEHGRTDRTVEPAGATPTAH